MNGSCRVLRSLAVLAIVFGVLALVAAPPAAAAKASKKKPAKGSIQGRIQPSDAISGAELSFTVDGATVRPRFQSGSFLIRNVPAGNHALAVTTGGNLGAHLVVDIRKGTTTQIGTLGLVAGGQITGIVSRTVDPGTGELEPLAGVEVVAETDSGWWDGGGGDGGIEPPVVDPIRLVAVTDENGVYSFRAVPSGSYRVSVVVPGMEAGVEFVWVEAGQTAAADFRLHEAIEEGVGTVFGSVTDAKGNPIEGAAVTLYAEEIYYPVSVSPACAGRAKKKGRLRGAVSSSLPIDYFATLTDEHGEYRLHVASGHLSLSVFADGYYPAERRVIVHPREKVNVDVALDADLPPPGEGVVEGTVTDAETGKPIPDVTIGLISARAGPNSPIQPPTTTTDQHGHYRLAGVPAGKVLLFAETAGYNYQTQPVEVKDGSSMRLDFALEPGDDPHPR
jgi:hypothetical protein